MNREYYANTIKVYNYIILQLPYPYEMKLYFNWVLSGVPAVTEYLCEFICMKPKTKFSNSVWAWKCKMSDGGDDHVSVSA